MKAKDLAAVWSRPDNSRLVPKQISIRLPVHVAARIRALEEMYPTRSRSEILCDLLSAALDDLQKGLPSWKGEYFGNHPDDGDLWAAEGPMENFRQLSNKHYQQIEKEMGNAKAPPLYPNAFVGGPADFDE